MDIAKAFCPECRAPMRIRRLVCPQGHVAMEGEFEVPTLARLSLEEQLFVTAFVRCHGSIKRMEELFEISYPTVKNRLNAIGAKLDRALDAPSPNLELLERLERGEVTVEEVLAELG
ncbi:MAG TPA: DUF2089 family protein [Thermoanaerobaculia bacterium]|jgi:hypothetical protein|nr:DUF2089 family protein [Thermoanaerobaculia bacterium]HXO26072.1 DUF2089 family protein [Thermoanaerobaculia bacterium]